VLGARLRSEFPTTRFNFTQPIIDSVTEDTNGTLANLAIESSGPDSDVLLDLANRTVELVREVPGASTCSARRGCRSSRRSSPGPTAGCGRSLSRRRSRHPAGPRGAGFIGSHIVDRLRAAGHAVAVRDDLSSGSRDNLPAIRPGTLTSLNIGTGVGPSDSLPMAGRVFSG